MDYTIEVLEDLDVRLDELIYTLNKIANDCRVDFSKREKMNCMAIAGNLQTVKNSNKHSIKERYKKQKIQADI